MFRLLGYFGHRVIFSRRHQTVRRTFIFIVTNFLAIASVIFSLEVVLIILGARGISIPFNEQALRIITRFFI